MGGEPTPIVAGSGRLGTISHTYLLHRRDTTARDGIRLHSWDTSSSPSRFNYSLSDHCVRMGCLRWSRPLLARRRSIRHMGVDTGHGPVVEAGGGLVAIAAAVDRAEFRGGQPGGGDLGDWAARAHQIKHLAAESSGWGSGTDTAPSTDVVTSSDIDSGNRGLEGSR